MSITLQEAKELKHGTILYHVINRNSDGSPQRWRVNGQVKTWKRDTTLISVPLKHVKHGLYDFDHLFESDLDIVCLSEEEALK